MTSESHAADLYVEVFHQRGNVSLFQAVNPSDTTHIEEIDVWKLRAAGDDYWTFLFAIEQEIIKDGGSVLDIMVVTRYPELERDLQDTPYHPSVPSWKIDPIKVKEYFNGRIQ